MLAKISIMVAESWGNNVLFFLFEKVILNVLINFIQDYVRYDVLAKEIVTVCENNSHIDLVEISKTGYKVDCIESGKSDFNSPFVGNI